MRLRTKPTLAALWCLLLLIAPFGYSTSAADAATCVKLPADKGSASTSFTVETAGTYQVWAHVRASSSGSSNFDLAFDKHCAIEASTSKQKAGSFHWLNTAKGSKGAPITVTLKPGTHKLTVAGKDPSVGIDEILLLTDATCKPVDDGSNCTTSTAAKIDTNTPATQAPVQHNISAAKLVGIITLAVGIAAPIIFLLWRRHTTRQFYAPASILPEPQSPDMSSPAPVVGTGLQNINALSRHKYKLLYVLVLCIVGIVAALTTIALATPNTSITIDLSVAKVAGQAKLVKDADAINGRMVMFGKGKQKASTPTTSTRSGTSSSSGTSSGSGSSTSSGSSWWSTSTTGSGSLIPSSKLNTGGCDYQVDTWSGDASAVGYSVTHLSHSNGNPGSFSVKIDANSNNKEVVGYPSLQCLLYEGIPSNLNSSFQITPPSSSSGLDYEYAYDIWLTTKSKATNYNWDNDLELMIWNYTVNQKPAGYYSGGLKKNLSDGTKIYVDGNNTTGIVSVVLPSNIKQGNIHIAKLITKLKSYGYISSSLDGILDVEYGIEAPYGGNKTFTVNSLSLFN